MNTDKEKWLDECADLLIKRGYSPLYTAQRGHIEFDIYLQACRSRHNEYLEMFKELDVLREKQCLCKSCKPFKDQPEIKYINKQSEIERLEKAYAEAMNTLNSDELLRQHMNFIGYRELDKLKEQLKKKDQIIEKAEKALNNYAIADDVGAIARQYFNDKQKDEVNK